MFKSKYYLPVDKTAELLKHEQELKTFTYDKDINVYKDAIILPIIRYHDQKSGGEIVKKGGVCDQDFNFLAGYYASEQSSGRGALEYIHSYKAEDIEQSEETVIFLGDLNKHFGHFITDSMTRMWYAAKHPDKKIKIALLQNPNWDWSAWELDNSYHLSLLELIGIKKEQIIIINHPTKFRSVIVPKQSVYWQGKKFNPELLKIVYDKARQGVHPKNVKKIYLSRSAWVRPILNEAYFMDFFASRGFKILQPQELPLEEQIAYISGADEIACTYGTLSHFAGLFSRPGTKLICLLRHYDPKGIDQQIIDKIKGLDCVYIDTSFNFLPSSHLTTFNLIIPTVHWRLFLKNEYELVDDSDVFDYLNKSAIKFGDYFKLYLHWLGSQLMFKNIYGFNFNPIRYLQSLYNALDPDGANRMLKAVKITDNPLFRDKLFIYKIKSSEKNLECMVKLQAGGNIWPVDINTLDDEKSWSFNKGRLYFFDKDLNPVAEFVVQDSGNTYAHVKYKGVLRSRVTDICILKPAHPGALRNWVIRHIIKYLVNRRRYKKLKQKPERFFSDSKTSVIRFLGKYYIRGNSTVIFFWRKRFHEYFKVNDMRRKVISLKEGMDEVSQKYVDQFMKLSKYWYKSSYVGSQWTEHDLIKQRQCKRFAKMFEQPFPDILHINPYYFFDIYGLADLPQEVLASIDGKLIIDGGGMNGDTALVFHQNFPNSEIHVYEPIENYIYIMKKFLETSDCGKKIYPINKGLGYEPTIKLMTYIHGANMAEITTIDSEYKDKNDRIGLIKLDTEGMETNIIKGAKMVIARDRPVLAIAMYHRPEDFFDLKYKLKSINSDYRFMVRKSEPSIPQADLILIAY